MSLGQKSLWIFVPGLKIDKRREQKQHYALLRSQQLLRAKALRVEGPSEISRNSPKIIEHQVGIMQHQLVPRCVL